MSDTEDNCNIFVGVNLPGMGGVSNELVVDSAIEDGYSFITSRITSSHFQKTVGEYLGLDIEKLLSQEKSVEAAYLKAANERGPVVYDSADDFRGNSVNFLPPPLIDDIVLLPGDHTYKTMAVFAPWANIGSVDPWFARFSYFVLRNECDYACYCGLSHIILDMRGRKTVDNEYYISALVHEFTGINIILMLDFDSWHLWDRIRVLCGYANNLWVGLDVDNIDYSLTDNIALVRKWKCEPIKMLSFSHSKVLPLETASERLRPILRELMVLDPYLLVNEDLDHKHDTFCRNFVDMIKFLLKIGGKKELADNIRYPLQPLSQPLTSDIYEIFQKDKSKYELYFQAIVSALETLKHKNVDEPITVTIAGAGKGGLIEPTLSAIKLVGIEVSRIYAIEKFSGPVISLQACQRVELDWDIIQIVHADVRYWEPEVPTNLIISELLGSFGDNELSPECLKPLETNPKVLAPGGIIIPQSYTSYVSPVFCPLLWQRARDSPFAGTQGAKLDSNPSNSPNIIDLDIPRVVKLNQAQILASPQPVWTFSHPNPKNAVYRQSKTIFDVNAQSRVYGFAGFFEATLHGNVKISTLPSETCCQSWYPFMFFLSKPLDIYNGSKVGFSLMRAKDDKQAWYEWFADAETVSPSRITTCIHNKNGASSHMQLFSR